MNRAFKYLMANNELLRVRQRTSRGIRQAMEGGRIVNKPDPLCFGTLRESGAINTWLLDLRAMFKKATILRNIPF
jgi:hypothetical protein